MKSSRRLYYILPVLGFVFSLWYIRAAAYDVVYSDYIRIVLNYLPNVWAADRFFRADVLTRIPITYLARGINVTFFHYSTAFDRLLGIIGLTLSALVLARYCDRNRIGISWFLFLMYLMFGLDKWEMLTNGTGWVHFLAFACFYFHYLLFDCVLNGETGRRERVILLAFPSVVTLGIAGPYCAVYTAVMVLAYGAVWAAVVIRKKGDGTCRLAVSGRFCLAGILSVVIPLLIYMWSHVHAVYVYDGAADVSLAELMTEQPEFLLRFLLRAMASMVIGGETMNELQEAGMITKSAEYLLGVFLGAGYLLALFLNLRTRLYKRTLFPLMLLFAGIGNHMIVLMSRCIYLKTSYGMSSRYALQYQAGLLGIVLTFALALKPGAGKAIRGLAAAFCLMILCGHVYTDYREIQKAPYRREYGERIMRAALNYEALSDDEIRETFDYREKEPGIEADVRRALGILKENRWNVFYKE